MTPTTEEWRTVPGWEGLYEVSDQGRVRSVDRLTDNGRGVLRRNRGQVLRAAVNPQSGRRTVSLCVNGRCVTHTIYRLVLAAFVGPCPPGMEGCHNDGNPANDRLDNLRWDTSSENNYDTVHHGSHVNARKTHCAHGHLLQPPNLLASARRMCLACNRAKYTVRKARERGIELDYQAVAAEHYAKIIEE